MHVHLTALYKNFQISTLASQKNSLRLTDSIDHYYNYFSRSRTVPPKKNRSSKQDHTGQGQQ